MNKINSISKRFILAVVSVVFLLVENIRESNFILEIEFYITDSDILGLFLGFIYRALFVAFLAVILIEYLTSKLRLVRKVIFTLFSLLSCLYIFVFLNNHMYIVNELLHVDGNYIFKVIFLLAIIMPYLIITVTGIFDNKIVRRIGMVLCGLSIIAGLVFRVLLSLPELSFILCAREAFKVFSLFSVCFYTLRTDNNRLERKFGLMDVTLLMSFSFIYMSLYDFTYYFRSDLLRNALVIVIGFLFIQMYYNKFSERYRYLNIATVLLIALIAIIGLIGSFNEKYIFIEFVFTASLLLFVFDMIVKKPRKYTKYIVIVGIYITCLLLISVYVSYYTLLYYSFVALVAYFRYKHLTLK